MAGVLSHRSKCGWERVQFTLADGRIAEIGYGRAPFAGTQEHTAESDGGIAAYSGVFFDAPANPCSNLLRESERPSCSPEALLEDLRGAFVLAMASENTLYLQRDPSGIKVLYWTRHRDRIVFASEIKALFADSSVPRTLRISALPEYLTFSFVPGSRTMFEGIYELQPGSLLSCQGDEPKIRRYFLFERHELNGGPELPPEHYFKEVRTELEHAVKECCIQDAPPAVFVSGGIDSSAVLAVTARQFSGIPIKTFSVHFGLRYANENGFVQLMVDRYKTDHTWLQIEPSGFLDRMRHIIWILDDPIGDPITVPNFLLAEAASRVSPLVLNGEGGDPCFGGPKNIPMILSMLYGAQAHFSGSGLEKAYLWSFRKCYEDLAQILNPDILKESGGKDALEETLRPYLHAAEPKSFLNRLMATNIRLKGANLILVKVDKMTSANGVLALPPLFSGRIIEASMACPPTLKLWGNIEKFVLKKAVEDIVPQPIVDRPKSGMMVPVRFWFQADMKRYAQHVLSVGNLKQLGLFNADYVRSLLKYHVTDTNRMRYGTKLWMLITFMLWHELMIQSSPVEQVSASRPEGFWRTLFTNLRQSAG
jgi:asparagine synthase (glutamine-hydrolysing)